MAASRRLPARRIEGARPLALVAARAAHEPRGVEVELSLHQLRGHAGQELTFGIRPEHLTEAMTNGAKSVATFDAGIEVVEPMGNETMVFFAIKGTEVCARTDPNAGAKVGSALKMAAHLDHMHLIDNASGRVL